MLHRAGKLLGIAALDPDAFSQVLSEWLAQTEKAHGRIDGREVAVQSVTPMQNPKHYAFWDL